MHFIGVVETESSCGMSFSKSRCDDRVLSKAVLIVGGVRNDGYRDVLGVSISDAESAAPWNELFTALKRRGLRSGDRTRGLRYVFRTVRQR